MEGWGKRGEGCQVCVRMGGGRGGAGCIQGRRGGITKRAVECEKERVWRKIRWGRAEVRGKGERLREEGSSQGGRVGSWGGRSVRVGEVVVGGRGREKDRGESGGGKWGGQGSFKGAGG